MQKDNDFGGYWWNDGEMIAGMVVGMIIGVVGTLMFVWLS